MKAGELADLVVDRLEPEADRAAAAFTASGTVRHAVIDDVLPDDVAHEIATAFPPVAVMQLRSSLRERKYVAAQMDRFDPVVEAAVFAFQDERVVDLVGAVTGLRALEPDEHLYGGGISAMTEGQFLNPHVDNSHDKDRRRWRVLNLLYYATPAWPESAGGALELWPDGVRRAAVTIPSRFNRLVVMETHAGSLHSVSPVRGPGERRCVSNYYFSPHPARATDTFHPTTFRARPGQPMRDVVLRADGIARAGIRRLFPNGIYTPWHQYRRPGPP